MKKVILSIMTITFVTLVLVNVNLALTGEKGNFSGLSLKDIMVLAQGETGRTDKFIMQSSTLEKKYGEYKYDAEKKQFCRTFYQKIKVTCSPGGTG